MGEKLDKETIVHALELVKEKMRYHNDKIDIMDFYGYDENQEDGDEYGFWYSGPEELTEVDWALASLYMRIKQDYEHYTYGGVSFGMDIRED